MQPHSELVVLRGGLSMPLPSLRLLWDLESRGFRFRLLDDGKLEVVPASQLSAEDFAKIRANRDALIALVRYEAPEVG